MKFYYFFLIVTEIKGIYKKYTDSLKNFYQRDITDLANFIINTILVISNNFPLFYLYSVVYG